MIALESRLNRLESQVCDIAPPANSVDHSEDADRFRELFGLPVPEDTSPEKITEGVSTLQRCLRSGDFSDFIAWRTSCSDSYHP